MQFVIDGPFHIASFIGRWGPLSVIIIIIIIITSDEGKSKL